MDLSWESADESSRGQMLEWFGLRFDPVKEWTIEIDPDVSEQQAHVAAFLARSRTRS